MTYQALMDTKMKDYNLIVYTVIKMQGFLGY